MPASGGAGGRRLRRLVRVRPALPGGPVGADLPGRPQQGGQVVGELLDGVRAQVGVVHPTDERWRLGPDTACQLRA